MVPEFKGIVDDMVILLEKLNSSKKYEITDCKNLPHKGIYVLYEDEKAIYVGRSNNIKKRLDMHRRPGSKHNQASFAFNLAKEKYSNPDKDIMSRDQIEKDDVFKVLFSEAKARVSAMHVRVIGIEEPEKQAIFEIYAAMALRTQRYNSFDNH